ncbi:MAG: 1,4-alpha-glucan branching protein GlgB [Alphaproteobacteria bacterium]|nr:1,4-alpha-glucan branching protein GlgB [Alphaproteobacteria bacterium]
MTVFIDIFDAISDGQFLDPFSFLGSHSIAKNSTEVRAFLPHALQVNLITKNGSIPFCKVGEKGGFVAEVQKDPGLYELEVHYADCVNRFYDPYQFGSLLPEEDLALFSQGNHTRLDKILGAHEIVVGSVRGVLFSVWAPNAKRVSVIGSFNMGNHLCHPMRLRHQSGVWELFLPQAKSGDWYKFHITDSFGGTHVKADPVAFQSEHPPRTASLVKESSAYQWGDQKWIKEREVSNPYHKPMSIYECHLGSWRRVQEEGNRFLTYRELTSTLIPYVKEMGFTHIELLPIAEYPYDGSWGYQPLGLYAPTSRFGSPADFAYFIDQCHQNGIGVILDWVIAHFPIDEYGLKQFDGSYLYEHEDWRMGWHSDWETLIYNVERHEVADFLISNADFWFREFHIDGLRVDAVSSMIYLDYSRKDGEWLPNMYGGNINFGAVDFLKRLNTLMYERYPGILMIAEESTAFHNVSRPTYAGGLGFGFKWNMGWMNDVLRYFEKDPIYRHYEHHHLTFGMIYAYSENFILSLSHDEVVHGKQSLLSKMPGDAWQKFANLRALYGFMYGHPGKKLLFMGSELAQWKEWNHQESLDWHLLQEEMFHHVFHRGTQKLVQDLNSLYQTQRALFEMDHESSGFEWVDYHDRQNSVISFYRHSATCDLTKKQSVLVICNLTPVPRYSYLLTVSLPGCYKIILNTDDAIYGGTGLFSMQQIEMVDGSLKIDIPPLSTLFLIYEGSPEYA